MKLYIQLCLLSLLLVFISCQEEFDALEENALIENSIDPLKDLKKGESGQKGGRWLTFESQKSYDAAYNKLLRLYDSERPDENSVVLVKGDKDGYGVSYDPSPILHLFEVQSVHTSLRKRLLIDEDTQLRRGREVDYVLRNLDDRGITNVIEQTLLSEEGVVRIGDEILYAPTKTLRIAVLNGREDIMTKILSEGLDVLYEPEVLENIKVMNTQKKTVSECTADFNFSIGGLDAENETGIVSLIWNNGDASGADDLQLTWDFGDGSSTTTSGAIATHTYENLEPDEADNNFTICVTAIYSYTNVDGLEVKCNSSSCQTINIKLPKEELDLCQIVGTALSVLQVFGVDPYTFNPTPGNGHETCGDAGDLVVAFANYADQLNFTWGFQGQGTQEGISGCFNAPCDGEYVTSLTISNDDGEICAVLQTNYQHSIEAFCEGKVDIQYKDDFEYYISGDRFKSFVRAKHETDYDDGFFSTSPNQVEGEIKSYKKKWWGWKKTPRHHEIHMEGNVYTFGNACACGGPYDDIPGPAKIETAKKTTRNQPMFPSSAGIFCRVDDPYFVTLKVKINGNYQVDQTYTFPH